MSTIDSSDLIFSDEIFLNEFINTINDDSNHLEVSKNVITTLSKTDSSNNSQIFGQPQQKQSRIFTFENLSSRSKSDNLSHNDRIDSGTPALSTRSIFIPLSCMNQSGNNDTTNLDVDNLYLQSPNRNFNYKFSVLDDKDADMLFTLLQHHLSTPIGDQTTPKLSFIEPIEQNQSCSVKKVARSNIPDENVRVESNLVMGSGGDHASLQGHLKRLKHSMLPLPTDGNIIFKERDLHVVSPTNLSSSLFLKTKYNQDMIKRGDDMIKGLSYSPNQTNLGSAEPTNDEISPRVTSRTTTTVDTSSSEFNTANMSLENENLSMMVNEGVKKSRNFSSDSFEMFEIVSPRITMGDIAKLTLPSPISTSIQEVTVFPTDGSSNTNTTTDDKANMNDTGETSILFQLDNFSRKDVDDAERGNSHDTDGSSIFPTPDISLMPFSLTANFLLPSLRSLGFESYATPHVSSKLLTQSNRRLSNTKGQMTAEVISSSRTTDPATTGYRLHGNCRYYNDYQGVNVPACKEEFGNAAALYYQDIATMPSHFTEHVKPMHIQDLSSNSSSQSEDVVMKQSSLSSNQNFESSYPFLLYKNHYDMYSQTSSKYCIKKRKKLNDSTSLDKLQNENDTLADSKRHHKKKAHNLEESMSIKANKSHLSSNNWSEPVLSNKSTPAIKMLPRRDNQSNSSLATPLPLHTVISSSFVSVPPQGDQTGKLKIVSSVTRSKLSASEEFDTSPKMDSRADKMLKNLVSSVIQFLTRWAPHSTPDSEIGINMSVRNFIDQSRYQDETSFVAKVINDMEIFKINTQLSNSSSSSSVEDGNIKPRKVDEIANYLYGISLGLDALSTLNTLAPPALKRRVYTIIKVFEELSLVEQDRTHRYSWSGPGSIPLLLALFQNEAMTNSAYTSLLNKVQSEGVPVDPLTPGYHGDTNTSNNIGTERITASALPVKPSLVKAILQLYLAGMNNMSVNEICVYLTWPGLLSDKDSSDPKRIARRIYDVSNLLCSLGFLRKVQQGGNLVLRWSSATISDIRRLYFHP